MYVRSHIIIARFPLKFPTSYDHQDTRSCVVQPSSGMQDTMCYLHEPTFSRFQLLIAQKLLGQF